MEKSKLCAVGNPGSKCLQFDPINTTCTSNATANSSISTAISQQVRYTPARFPIGSIDVSPIRSHPYGLVLEAFPGQLTVRPPCESFELQDETNNMIG